MTIRKPNAGQPRGLADQSNDDPASLLRKIAQPRARQPPLCLAPRVGERQKLSRLRRLSRGHLPSTTAARLAHGRVSGLLRGSGVLVKVPAMAAPFESGTRQEIIDSGLPRSVSGWRLQSRGAPSPIDGACLISHDTVASARCSDQSF
ncbi:hypothetical protein ACWEKM_40675 [Streptomyces sp. NPDC004752]